MEVEIKNKPSAKTKETIIFNKYYYVNLQIPPTIVL